MSNPRGRKILRDLWLHKARTTMVVLAIAIGIVGAGAVLDTWALVRRATVEQFLASNPVSATLRLDSIDATLLSAVKARHDIRNVEVRRTMNVTGRSSAGSLHVLLVSMPNLASNSIGALAYESGAWPPRDGEIALEASGVTYAQLALGDSLTIESNGNATRVPVTGVARDVTVAPGWMEHYVTGFLTPATLARLHMPSSMNELRLVVNDSVSNREHIRRVAYDVKRVAESRGHRVYGVEVPTPRQHIHAAQMNSFLFAQGAFGVLALLLSGLLVVTLITAMLTGQVREIGIMRTVGASEGQIARMYLMLALVLGLVACAIAMPVAALIGRAYAKFTADMLNFRVAGMPIPRGALALQFIVGALLPVIAAAIPVRRGSRVTVSAALRDEGIVDNDRATATAARLLARANGINRALLLALRNALRRRQRAFLTALTLAVGGAMYIGALNLQIAVAASVDRLFAPWHYDLLIRLDRPTTADSLERALARVPGVARAEAWGGMRAAVANADGTMGDAFGIVAIPATTLMVSTEVTAGRWLKPGETDAIVVNTRLVKDDSSVRVGRVMPIVAGGERRMWRVVGVAEINLEPLAFLSREGRDGVVDEAVIVSTTPGHAAALDLAQRLRLALGDGGLAVASTQLVDATRSAVKDHLVMMVQFLGVMAQLIIVIGGLGLAAAMSIAVLERTREIGVLRAIGARQSSILGLIQIEGLAIAMASWVMALPLSVPLSYGLARIFGKIMLPTPAVYWPGVGGLVRWMVVVVVVSLVSCLGPAGKAMKVPVQRALAYQ
jgi:putative ABC transport system permease protein